jgi:hypothetical protein
MAMKEEQELDKKEKEKKEKRKQTRNEGRQKPPNIMESARMK